MRVENGATWFTNTATQGQTLRVPISHGEGNYFADDETIALLEREGRVVFRYCDEDGEITEDANPNGSVNNIAGNCESGQECAGDDAASGAELPRRCWGARMAR